MFFLNDSNEWLNLSAQQLAALSPIEEVCYSAFQQAGVQLCVKRDELIHPILSGNKLYKLWGYLQQAKHQRATGLVSMGGYYSNHLHALAYASQQMGLPCIGYVRGHRPEQLSPTLQDCQRWGMELRFVSRVDYRQACDQALGLACAQKEGAGQTLFHSDLKNGWLIIPEGGSGSLGMQGCMALGQHLVHLMDENTIFCAATGTGTTLAGITAGMLEATQPFQHSKQNDKPLRYLAFAALKLGDRLDAYQQGLMQSIGNCCNNKQGSSLWLDLDVIDDQHFGGFARSNDELLTFIQDFNAQTGIQLEPVYTGKMLYQLSRMAEQGKFKAGQRLLVLHSGGLQGLRGLRV